MGFLSEVEWVMVKLKMLSSRAYKIFCGILAVAFLSFYTPPLFAQPSIIETIQDLFPSIVSIKAENASAAQSPRAAAAIDKNTGRLIVLRKARAAHYQKTGAGVIVNPAGFIATNYHTIADADLISVTLFDNTTLTAKVISVFPQMDLALLGIKAEGPLVPVIFADSDTLSFGDEVFTVGHSEILDKTISEGKIIGLGVQRTQTNENTGTQLLQVNINLYKGDSGGPLFDRRGRLAGMIVAGQTAVDRSSFAVPSNQIKKLTLESLSKIKQ